MIKFLPDGDVAGAIMAASEGQIDTGVDLLLGTGGTPEGVIAAAALRCLGGSIFARLAPAQRRGALGGDQSGLRPGQDPDHQRPVRRRGHLLRGNGCDGRRAAQGGAVQPATDHHPLVVDARAIRHLALHRDLPRPGSVHPGPDGAGRTATSGLAAMVRHSGPTSHSPFLRHPLGSTTHELYDNGVEPQEPAAGAGRHGGHRTRCAGDRGRRGRRRRRPGRGEPRADGRPGRGP